MPYTSHIIWEWTVYSNEKIRRLRKNGVKRIYIRVPTQREKVRIEGDIYYLSTEAANLLFLGTTNKVHHFVVNKSTKKL